jgi:hypothetical protein
MAIPVYVPYDEGLVGQVPRPDHGVRVQIAQSLFELAGFGGAALHQSFDLADEREVVSGVQEERGTLPARPQRFHLASVRVAATGSRLVPSGSACRLIAKEPIGLASGSRPEFWAWRGSVDQLEPGRVRQDVDRPVVEGEIERAAAGPQVPDRECGQPLRQRRVDVDP